MDTKYYCKEKNGSAKFIRINLAKPPFSNIGKHTFFEAALCPFSLFCISF